MAWVGGLRRMGSCLADVVASFIADGMVEIWGGKPVNCEFLVCSPFFSSAAAAASRLPNSAMLVLTGHGLPKHTPEARS